MIRVEVVTSSGTITFDGETIDYDGDDILLDDKPILMGEGYEPGFSVKNPLRESVRSFTIKQI